jgi:hypothetical protein
MAKMKLDNQWSAPGRLIMGSLTEKNDKDHEGNPIPPEKQGYFFGVAIPKTEPHFTQTLWPAVFNLAATDYAQVPLVMQQIQQGLGAEKFSWKIEDGDAVRYDRRTGQVRPNPEYMKGHFILKFSTMFEVACCDANQVDISPRDIKRGDFVDVIFNVAANGKNDHTAGLYFNPVAVRRLGFGDPIGGGAPASSVFGNAGHAPQLPPGASAIPTASGPAALPAGVSMPGAPMPGAPMPGAPMPGAPMPGAPMPGAPMPGAPMPGNYAPAPAQTGHAGMPGMPAPAGAAPQTAYPTTPYHGIMQPGQIPQA